MMGEGCMSKGSRWRCFKSKLMADEILIEFENDLFFLKKVFWVSWKLKLQVWSRIRISSINKRFTSISHIINQCLTYQFFFVSCLRLSFHLTWLPNPWCALSMIWLWAWLKLMMPRTFALDSRQEWFITTHWKRFERWQYTTQRQRFESFAVEITKLSDDGRL